MNSAIDPEDRFDPDGNALFFNRIEADNYLAHSIREIEKHIVRVKGRNYPIKVFKGPRPLYDHFLAFFHIECCDIKIPHSSLLEDDSTMAIRLSIAHELAHIVYNLNLLPGRDEIEPQLTEKLKQLNTTAKNRSEDEEFYSWIFAYRLILEKSEYYKKKKAFPDFIYDKQTLQKTVAALAQRHSPKVQERVNKHFSKYLPSGQA